MNEPPTTEHDVERQRPALDYFLRTRDYFGAIRNHKEESVERALAASLFLVVAACSLYTTGLLTREWAAFTLAGAFAGACYHMHYQVRELAVARKVADDMHAAAFRVVTGGMDPLAVEATGTALSKSVGLTAAAAHSVAGRILCSVDPWLYFACLAFLYMGGCCWIWPR